MLKKKGGHLPLGWSIPSNDKNMSIHLPPLHFKKMLWRLVNPCLLSSLNSLKDKPYTNILAWEPPPSSLLYMRVTVRKKSQRQSEIIKMVGRDKKSFRRGNNNSGTESKLIFAFYIPWILRKVLLWMMQNTISLSHWRYSKYFNLCDLWFPERCLKMPFKKYFSWKNTIRKFKYQLNIWKSAHAH